MIENPKVGQRVAAEDWNGDIVTGKVSDIGDRHFWCMVAVDGVDRVFGYSALYDAAALRSEAQRLMDAADKLDEEAEQDAEIEANRLAYLEALRDKLESEEPNDN